MASLQTICDEDWAISSYDSIYLAFRSTKKNSFSVLLCYTNKVRIQQT